MRLLFFSICDSILTTHPSSTTPISFQSPTVFNSSIPSFGSVNAGCWGQTCVRNVGSPAQVTVDLYASFAASSSSVLFLLAIIYSLTACTTPLYPHPRVCASLLLSHCKHAPLYYLPTPPRNGHYHCYSC
ncbi:hypothetical protein F5I97DRAFT_1433817 [Phlebopus sp. FC_14]|nr:hypothetical protein F5I97DRAFT_1433817 [Phlebopus sp. FC_14]